MRALAPLLAAVAVLASGCAHKKRIAPAPIPVERPLISLEAAKVESLSFGGLALVFRCRIENPNPFPLAVAGVRYGLALEGRSAASGAVAAPVEIPAAAPEGMGTGSVTVPVTVRFSDVPAFAPLLARDRDAAYALSGEVAFATPAGPVAVPLSQAGVIAIPRAPRFKVSAATLRAASPREITIEMAVDVRNPNAFSIPAGHIRYGLFLSNKEVARTEVNIPEPIAGGATAAIAVPVKISVLKAGTAVAKLMLPFSSMGLGVRGEAVFGGVPVPLDLEASLVPGK